SLHSARRFEAWRLAHARGAHDHDAARRPLAWRELVVHDLGRPARNFSLYQLSLGEDLASRSTRKAEWRARRGLDRRVYRRHVSGCLLRLDFLPAEFAQ